MSSYIASIRFSVMSFPIIALICTIPYMIYQYRKFGRIPFWKTFIVYAFIFYITTAYYMVILPLPQDHTALVPYAATPQLIPFTFISDIARESSFSISDPATWFAALKCSTMCETFFNVLMTIPLGLFLRYFFKCRWWQVLLIGLATSLFFELSQLTGLWGMYEHPYRLFDVDDLMINTLGAMVGFWIAMPLSKHLPDIDQINEESRAESAMYTTFSRRLFAFLIDLAPITAIYFIFDLLAPGIIDDLLFDMVVATASTGIFFMLVPAATGGATLGDKVLKLRIVRPDGSRASGWQCIARYLMLFWAFLLLPMWVYVLLPQSLEGATVSSDLFAFAMTTFYSVWVVTIVVRAIRSAMRHPFVMLNGMISHTRIMSLEQCESLRRQAAGRAIGAKHQANLQEAAAGAEKDKFDELADELPKVDVDAKTDADEADSELTDSIPKV